MDSAFSVLLWIVRLAFLGLLYGFLIRAFASVQRALADERAAVRPAGLAVLVARPGGARHPLRAVNAIGRDPGGDVVLRDDAASARHAVIELVAGEWWVEDAGSTNGTRVNGHPVGSRTRLRYGDEVTIARTTLRLEQA
ncbi:MAG: FHA domain-containing protein [Chloroflexi bacterium]|nr:FHA domain-containing protein [Chloroflexota bacterium]